MAERARMNNGPEPVPPMRHEPTLLELEAALRIDTLDLINADSEQPELFYRIAKLLATLKAEHDALKLQVDDTKAQVENDLREALGDTRKPTVGQIEALVRVDPTVRSLNEQLTRINQQIGQASALKDAYVQRKSSLTDLVELQRQAGAAIDPAVVRQGMTDQRRNRR